MSEHRIEDEDGSEHADESSSALFPLSNRDLEILRELCCELRRELPRRDACFIRSAACAILAIERLPRPTPGVLVELGYRTGTSPGNWGWADITISDEEVCASIGEHFYDPAVVGDTESKTSFSATIGDERSYGDLENWFEHAKEIAGCGVLEVSDQSESDEIDWGETSGDWGETSGGVRPERNLEPAAEPEPGAPVGAADAVKAATERRKAAEAAQKGA
jgi:hypothetical protein